MKGKSGSKRGKEDDLEEVVARMRKEAGPVLAKALNLERAEAVEAGVNAMAEFVLAARAFLKALPLPPETRAHLDKAEAEAVRAARLAMKELDLRPSRTAPGSAPARQVKVKFRSKRSGIRKAPAPKRARTKR